MSINWRGIWSGDNTYQVGDAVYYLGSSFIAVDINTNTLPSETPSSWNLLASQGAVGVTGSQGVPGLTGPTGVGAQGVQGIQGDLGQGLTWRNTYSSSITYAAYDCVAFNGSSFICIADGVIGLEPDANPTQWNILCGGSGGGSSAWGGITGTLSAQTDLQAALNAKAATSSLATVATSGSYADLSNKPSIPAAQVQTDWNATTGEGVLLNKPTLATVATSGSYTDLTSKPSIPAAQVNSDWNAVSSVSQILNKPTLGTAAAQPTSAFDASGTSAAETTRAEAAEALLVPKTVTVNGHALSANIVVSASDLTTGTLPHAQLPALLSADIPANAANTTGSAAALTTARTINGTAFDGSANITITAAGSTLTGSSLPVGITTASGLTTVAGGTFGTAAFTASSAYDVAGAAATAQTNAEAAFTGDVTKSSGSFATTVMKVNGGAISTTGKVQKSNGSGQFVDATTSDVTTPVVFALTDGSTIALNWTNGDTQTVTITGNRTFTFSNPVAGRRYVIEVTQDTTGSRTLTWPTIRWQGGTAPTLTTTASKTDLIVLLYDGSSYFGQSALNF